MQGSKFGIKSVSNFELETLNFELIIYGYLYSAAY